MENSAGRKRFVGLCAAISAVTVLAVAAAVHAGMLDGLWKKTPAAAAKAAGVTEDADGVRIPLKSLDSGKALFLETESGGRQVRYFALKSADGKYRAAFDACDVCFRSEKGYRQEAEQMVCNNCGQTFPADRIGERKGGCNPHPLAHREVSGSMVLTRSDLASGAGYFPGSRQ